MSAVEIARIINRVEALEVAARTASPAAAPAPDAEARIQAALAEVKASIEEIKAELKEYVNTMLPTVPRRVEADEAAEADA